MNTRWLILASVILLSNFFQQQPCMGADSNPDDNWVDTDGDGIPDEFDFELFGDEDGDGIPNIFDLDLPPPVVRQDINSDSALTPLDVLIIDESEWLFRNGWPWLPDDEWDVTPDVEDPDDDNDGIQDVYDPDYYDEIFGDIQNNGENSCYPRQ